MGKIILHHHQSLNGIVTGMETWLKKMDDGIMQAGIDYYDTLDAVVFGGNTYGSLADYWTKAEESSHDAIERAFAKKINRIRKYVVSRKPVDTTWNNSQQIRITDDISSLASAMQELKQTHRKDISVDSGAKLWEIFLQHRLFDELLIYVHPVIAEEGKRFFPEPSQLTNLGLKSQKAYSDGTMELRYEKRD